MSRTRSIASALALGLVLGLGARSQAAFVTPTDLDTVDTGTSVAGPTTTDFIAPDASHIGSIQGQVFQNADTYTYVMAVTPTIDNISEFNTGFSILGFNGVAGYSFSSVSLAGGNPATDITIANESDNTLDWYVANTGNGTFFDSNSTVLFFFQSTLPPLEGGSYNIIDHHVGTGQAYQPIPEPASLSLIGIAGVALIRRRR